MAIWHEADCEWYLIKPRWSWNGLKPFQLSTSPLFAILRVCALHEQCTHHRRSVKMSNLQILLKIPIVRGWFFFQRVKIPYARGRARSISKSQGGLPWGMHWRKRDYKVRYWRTVNECSFTIVKPTVRWTVDEMKSGAWYMRHHYVG